MTYKPLPDFLEIRQSKIHGHGLFAKTYIPEGTVLGITHVEDSRFENSYIRTPLGGFFNHSEEPNCSALKEGDLVYLETIRPIEADEELTTRYWLYSLQQ